MSNFRYPYQFDELVSAKIVIEWKHRTLEIDVTPGRSGPRRAEVSMNWDHNYEPIHAGFLVQHEPIDSNLTIAFEHVLYEGLLTEKEPT